MYTIYKSE